MASETGALFGDAVKPLTAWGVEVDRLARMNGGWPDDVIVYALKIMDPDAPQDKAHVMMTGDVPVGVDPKGLPKWPKGKAAKPRTAICSIVEYRLAVAMQQAVKDVASAAQAAAAKTTPAA